MGYKLRSRSIWAGLALTVTYLAGVITSAVVWGILSGLLIKLGIAFLFFRGLLATVDYEEFSKKIAQLEAAEVMPAEPIVEG